jgi:hypothetical protein
MASVITATSGKALREFIASYTGDAVVFPEMSLDANEQAAYIKDNPHVNTIITLSPWIVSEATNLQVIDKPAHGVRFGDSVNKVSMNLWRKYTIGDTALIFLDTCVDADEPYKIGDSVERVFKIKELLDKQDQ